MQKNIIALVQTESDGNVSITIFYIRPYSIFIDKCYVYIYIYTQKATIYFIWKPNSQNDLHQYIFCMYTLYMTMSAYLYDHSTIEEFLHLLYSKKNKVCAPYRTKFVSKTKVCLHPFQIVNFNLRPIYNFRSDSKKIAHRARYQVPNVHEQFKAPNIFPFNYLFDGKYYIKPRFPIRT